MSNKREKKKSFSRINSSGTSQTVTLSNQKILFWEEFYKKNKKKLIIKSNTCPALAMLPYWALFFSLQGSRTHCTIIVGVLNEIIRQCEKYQFLSASISLKKLENIQTLKYRKEIFTHIKGFSKAPQFFNR